jgi:protein O-mannosyl-transferase
VHPFTVSRRLQGALIVLLAIAASATTLPNQFNQDDIPIILTNEAVHQLGTLWRAWAEPYWPAPFPPELYRPVAIVLFGLQWAIGDGAPIVFRLASLVMYVAATVLVWRLGVRLVGPTGGWIAAALFAVHPVHVEAVAVAVNQGELLVAIALLWATERYLAARLSSGRVPTRTAVGIVVATTVAMFAKETAVVLPGILILVEMTVVRDGTLRQRLAAVRPVVLGLVLATVTMAAIRDRVLAGDLKGTFTAESIAGQDMRGRAVTMAGVVPEVARLLVWPDHLRADYTPQEIPPGTAIGAKQVLGLGIAAAVVAIGLLGLRFAPVLAFALG